MSIRIRRVEGALVALCAAETDPLPGDAYLDDEVHQALATKFADDWLENWGTDFAHPELVALMRTQKVRDAREEPSPLAEHRSGFTRAVKEPDAGAGKCGCRESHPAVRCRRFIETHDGPIRCKLNAGHNGLCDPICPSCGTAPVGRKK